MCLDSPYAIITLKMKRSKMLSVGSGYTIVEALIFLAVSGGLLVASSTIISGRTENTKFSQGVVEVEQNLQDVFNDVSTGFFPSNGLFSCDNTGPDGLNISSVASAQGTNSGCIFVGKLIKFVPDSTDYTIYTMVGAKSATSLSSNSVKLLGIGTNPGISDTKTNTISLNTKKVITTSSVSPGETYSAIAIVSDFGTSAGSSVTGNASRVKLYGYTGSIGSISASKLTPGLFKLLDAPVVICLDQSGTKKASIKISPQLTMDKKINSQETVC